MKPQIFLVTAVVSGVVLGVGIWIWSARNTATPSVPPLGSENAIDSEPTVTPPVVALASRDDPAGFTIRYPENLLVNPHDEDQENYAHLEFTHPDHPGNLIVWVKDLPKSRALIADWIAGDKRFVGANILDTQLGGEPAKKILVTAPQRQAVVAALFDQVIFSLEATLGPDDFWQKTLETAVENFQFKPVNIVAPAADSPTFESEVTEEEVVE